MTALREIFASFKVEFDSKELQRGNREVRVLADHLGITNPQVIEFAQGLRAAGPTLAVWAAGVAAVGAGVGLVAHQVISATLEFAHFNTELDLNARRLGVSTDQMQALGLFAADAGQDLEAVTDAVSTLQERARDAVLDRQSDPAEQLRLLGVEIPRTTGELPDAITLLEQTADGFAAMENQTDRVGAAMTVFGDVGRELLPVLEGGADEIRAYAQELRELGGGSSREAIEASRELARAQVRLDLALTGLRSQLLTGLIPVLETFVSWLTQAVAWLNRNRSFLQAVGIAFAILAGIITAILLPVLALTFIALLPILITLGLVIIAVGAMVLVIQDLVVWLEGGNSVIGTFVESLLAMAGITMEGVREEISSVFDTLRDKYNSIASVVPGLPTIASNQVDTSNPGPKREGVTPQTPARSRGALGLDGEGFLANLRAETLARNGQNRAAELARSVGGRVAPATVNQENQINITSSDAQEVARQVERVLDRQNRDAAEALAQ